MEGTPATNRHGRRMTITKRKDQGVVFDSTRSESLHIHLVRFFWIQKVPMCQRPGMACFSSVRTPEPLLIE